VALVAGLGAALDYIAGQAGGDLEKGRIALIDNAQVNAAATRAAWSRWASRCLRPRRRRQRPRRLRCPRA
jgi:hypothetical protein